jgi:hypothetical protein
VRIVTSFRAEESRRRAGAKRCHHPDGRVAAAARSGSESNAAEVLDELGGSVHGGASAVA